jgi:hypothetical protein
MEYGHKRNYPKIDIYVNHQYEFTTTWAKNTIEAKLKASESLGIDVSHIQARRVNPLAWTRHPIGVF